MKFSGKKFKTFMRISGLTGYFLFALFPIFWILLMSLKGSKDVIAIPPKFIFTPTLENYKAITIGIESASVFLHRPFKKKGPEALRPGPDSNYLRIL